MLSALEELGCHINKHVWLAVLVVFSSVSIPAGAEIVEEHAIEKKWRNAAVIMHPYAKGLVPSANAVVLSTDQPDEAFFEVMSRRNMANAQPERILWTLEVISNTKFFRLQNLSSQQYLVREPGTTNVHLEESPASDDTHAQWFIQSFTNSGELAIYNRSEDQQYALVLSDDQLANDEGQSLEVTLAEITDLHATDHLLRIDSRFLEVALTAVDIEEGTCLVHLSNGAPMEGFFTPSPVKGAARGVTRQFRVNILGEETDPFYFVNDIGFDPLSESLTPDQEFILDEMRLDVAAMRLVVEENLDVERVFNGFLEQLSEAYNNEESATIVYFPESRTRLEVDEQAGRITKEFETLADKSLAMRVTVHRTLSSSYSYAFLVEQVLPDGSSDFSLVDPTDSSKPAFPR